MRELRWEHRGWFARRWELMESDRVLATLTQRGWGFNADLEHAGRRWRLEMAGVFRWSIRLVDEEGVERATMKMGWRGQGSPTWENGRRFLWDVENWWGTRWSLDEPERGARVADVHMDAFLRMNARAQVHEGAPPDELLVPLLALTWLSVIVTTQAASSAGAG